MAFQPQRLFWASLICMIGSIFCQFDQEIVQSCREKEADVFFVLDASSSIYIEDFIQQRQFVRSVINRLDVSPRYTRVGALVFSDNYQVAFDLDDFPTKDGVINAINNRTLRHLTGLTNTADAIRYVRESPQFRPDILKVMVVITDGNSRDQQATESEASNARKAGFYMFVIGVGQFRDEREWRAIASDPDDNFVYNVTDFRNLESLSFTIPQRMCVLPPIIVGQACAVTQLADIMFVSGSSSSSEALEMISSIVDNIEGNPDDVRLSLFLDSCTGAEDLPLQDPTIFCDRFTSAGDTDILDLMKRMRAAATQARRNRQTNQIAVIFMDDQSLGQNRFDVLQEGRLAAQPDGIKVYVVDLGVQNYRNFLPAIASAAENLISTRTTSQRLENAFLEKACIDLNALPEIISS